MAFPCQKKFPTHTDSFLHELQHRWDTCNGVGAKTGCFGSLCTEIRAYYLSDFRGEPPTEELKNKLKPKVQRSVMAYCEQYYKNRNEKFEKSKFEEEYDIEYEKQYKDCI